MRLHLSLDKDCYLEAGRRGEVQVRFKTNFNNFNNLTFGDNTRIYIESIHIPQIRRAGNIMDGILSIVAHDFEPEEYDFNSIVNGNDVNIWDSPTKTDYNYSSSDNKILNFKINKSFSNNLRFSFFFNDLKGRSFPPQFSLVDGNLFKGDAIDTMNGVSGVVDTSRTNLSTTIETDSYTVSRGGDDLTDSLNPDLYSIKFYIVVDALGEILSVDFDPDKVASSIDGYVYSGLGFMVGDRITFSGSLFQSDGSSGTDLVIEVASIKKSNAENDYDIHIAAITTAEATILNTKPDDDQLNALKNILNTTYEELTKTELPYFEQYLFLRKLQNPVTSSGPGSTGHLGDLKMAKLENAIATFKNGNFNSIFYFLLKTSLREPFDGTVQFADSNGTNISLKEAVTRLNTAWNDYWKAKFTYERTLSNYNWKYGISNPAPDGDGFPILYTGSYVSTVLFGYDFPAYQLNVTEPYVTIPIVVSGGVTPAAVAGELTTDIVTLWNPNINAREIYFNIKSMKPSTGNAFPIKNDKVEIGVLNMGATKRIPSFMKTINSINSLTIHENPTDAGRTDGTVNIVVDDTFTTGNGSGVYIKIVTNSIGVSTVSMTDTVKGFGFEVDDKITISKSLLGGDTDLILNVASIYDTTEGISFTVDEVMASTIPSIKNTLVQDKTYRDYAYSQIPKVQVVKNVWFNQYLVENNTLASMYMNFKIYNDDEHDPQPKVDKSRFKQNNYQSMGRCPCRAFIR